MSMSVLAGSGAPIGKAFAKYMTMLDQGVPVREADKQMQAEVFGPEALSRSLARKSPTEEHPPTDPVLTREVEIGKLKANLRTLMRAGSTAEENGKVVAEIARAMGMPVLMESFAATMPFGGFIQSGKQPLYQVLIGLEKAGFIWELSEGMLRIRPADWALLRSYDIPESFLAYYWGMIEKQGQLTLDDLAAIAAALTDEQIDNMLLDDPEWEQAVLGMRSRQLGDRDFLRVYGSLSLEQKRAAQTEGGLPFGQLNSTQWELLGNVITDRLGGVYITGGNLRLHADEKLPKLEVTVQVDDQEKPRSLNHVILVQSKESMARLSEARKKRLEAEKAQQDKDQSTPAPAPGPEE